MSGTYNVWIVALSIAVAIFASYTALDLAGRVTAARGRELAQGYYFWKPLPSEATGELLADNYNDSRTAL